ncbi:MAG: hypothetical protein ACOH2A_15025 [Sphingobacteriaceae bacterium]
MKLAYGFLILFLFITIACSGQLKPIEKVSYHSKRMNFDFKQPLGFQEMSRADTVFWPGKGSAFLNAISYKIKPNNADVVVALSFFDVYKSNVVSAARTRNYDRNNQLIGIRYLIGIPPSQEERVGKFNMLVDTSKVKFFDKAELKKYGATYGGIANIPMDKAYYKQYWKLKILFFFKEGAGEVYQYYFYNEGAPIEQTVRDTKYMVKFKS